MVAAGIVLIEYSVLLLPYHLALRGGEFNGVEHYWSDASIRFSNYSPDRRPNEQMDVRPTPEEAVVQEACQNPADHHYHPDCP